jgi:hypothetical protein
LAALEAVRNRVGISGNQNPAGFAMVAHAAPRSFIAALMDRSPIVKSMIANGMWQSAERATGIPANVIRGAVQSLMTPTTASGEDVK